MVRRLADHHFADDGFFSRYYIMELPFAVFLGLLGLCGWRFIIDPPSHRWPWAIGAGHAQPWHNYFTALFPLRAPGGFWYSEIGLLLLALDGMVRAFMFPARRARGEGSRRGIWQGDRTHGDNSR